MKSCLACAHSKKEGGVLYCNRLNPLTGRPIEIPRACSTQRLYGRFMNFLCRIFTGFILCGKNAKYFEPLP